jgi:hypothetical protein
MSLIGTKLPIRDVRNSVANGGRPDVVPKSERGGRNDAIGPSADESRLTVPLADYLALPSLLPKKSMAIIAAIMTTIPTAMPRTS